TATGNDGNDEVWCPNTDRTLADIDEMPEVLFNNQIFTVNKPTDPQDITHSDAYMDNVFPTVVSKLSKDQLAGLPEGNNAAAEIMALKASFNARLATFQMPFSRAIGQRLPAFSSSGGAVEEAMKSFRASLQYLSDDKFSALLKDYMADGNQLSEQSMDEIHYWITNIDPSTIINASGQSTLNNGNTQLFQALKMMDMTALLYDIRQTLRETNVLLGTMGAVMIEPRRDEIEQKIQSVSGQGG
ncbi:MAG: hypothetical protein KGQ41_04665, partial [Alphaproteobacteria bacterium]|nr:hypothetical protein [Alphaproteobacteria bacterium]